MTLRVLIADDHPVVRVGLRALIEANQAEVVAEARDAETATTLARATRPDVAVLDVRLGVDDGIKLASVLINDRIVPRVLMVSAFTGDETIHRALEAGALGFICKAKAGEDLATALRVVATGRRYMCDVSSRSLAAHGPRIVLTPREREVLSAMAEGLRNKEIGHRLGVTTATARTHVEHLLMKFACSDRSRVVALASARGFLD